MIKITDVGGNEKYINCDMIERIEAVPDTLLVLSNGHNFIVHETPEEVISRIIAFKKCCFQYHEQRSEQELFEKDHEALHRRTN